MGKPYRFRNLINLFVLLIMICSGLLTVVSFSILRGFRLLPTAFFATVWMPIVVLLVANIVAGIANYFLVPKVIRPIEALIEATTKVAAGDFTVQIPEDSGDGEISELVHSFNAMTRELRSIEIFRNDFIRDFSHEFKTPIVSMKGFAGQLKNHNLSEEEKNMYCDIIISESDRLSNMSTNILLLSKLETQEIIGEKSEYSLDEQLRDCVLLFEREWEKKKIEWELDLPSILLCHNADMLHHVWSNLFSNAIKFTPDGGKIKVSAAENEESVTITVRDSGIGMTEEEMKHIFDRCYQADASHTSAGNGLGLCIAKRICILSGGSISVRSTPKKGSVFTVILPK
jgi:signal transduction histidine kinase